MRALSIAVQRILRNPPVWLAIFMVSYIAVFFAQAHSSAQQTVVPVLESFASAIDEQVHECIPLGWFAETLPWRGFVEQYNVNGADNNGVFQARWVGVLSAIPNDPRAFTVKSVLDEMTRVGLLERTEIEGVRNYTLTHAGIPYFYDRNDLGNNVARFPYMCFSRLHTTRVSWNSTPTKNPAYRGATSARVQFAWESLADAPWVTPFLRRYAVVLNPTSSPTVATAVRLGSGHWALAEIDFAFPLVEDRKAWSMHR